MPSLIRIAGSLARLPGGALVTDANGAPCCCGPTVPPPPAGCCVCRTGGIDDACAGPIGCCIGRSFHVHYAGVLLQTLQTSVVFPPGDQWSSACQHTMDFDIIQINPTEPCVWEARNVAMNTAMQGQYTPATGQSITHQVSVPNIFPVPVDWASVSAWALASPRWLYEILRDAREAASLPFVAMFPGGGGTSTQGFLLAPVNPIRCDQLNRYPWQIGCMGLCSFPIPGTPFTEVTEWTFDQRCRIGSIAIDRTDDEAYTGPGGGLLTRLFSRYTAEYVITIIDPCPPTATAPAPLPPPQPRPDLPPWADGGCCG